MPRARNAKADEALALYRQGLRLVEIAKRLEIPEGTVRRWKCTQDWDGRKAERSQTEKPNARKRGGQPGNRNRAAPKGNKRAEKFGFFAKYLPGETLELMHLTADASPPDLLWAQIQLAFAAIVRAQKIAYVKNQEDKTIEKVSETQGDAIHAESWEVRQAWDKQADFLKAQARAMDSLRGLIKQYDEMLRAAGDAATEEQRLRLELLRAKLGNGPGDGKKVTIINDTGNPNQRCNH